MIKNGLNKSCKNKHPLKFVQSTLIDILNHYPSFGLNYLYIALLIHFSVFLTLIDIKVNIWPIIDILCLAFHTILTITLLTLVLSEYIKKKK